MPSSTKISELQVNNFKKVPFVYHFITKYLRAFLHKIILHGGLFKTVMYNFRSNPLIKKELSEND